MRLMSTYSIQFLGLWLLRTLVISAKRPQHPREPIGLPVPTRPLEWGDVNFLATSDTHGWLLGHQHATWPEPNYSADFGDLASFVTHMRTIANQRGSDLILVDAGDHHDGSGLVSSSVEGAIRADQIFNQLEYDVLTIGNHELYDYKTALAVYKQAKLLGGRYLTSNVNITLDTGKGEDLSIPIGERFRKWKTPKGRKVTAFGVLFNFYTQSYGISVQAPADMVKEDWFVEAVRDKPDYFVLVGHMPARGETSEWAVVREAIGRMHPTTPVFVFGGHTHVRDCVQYDDWSIGIVPGKYMETVAFVSSTLPSLNSGKTPKMTRRYLDSNRISFQYHSATPSQAFDTNLGLNITSSLLNLATELNISSPLGKAPSDLYLNRYAIGDKRSLLTEFAEKVMPLIVVDKKRKGERVLIGNSGTLRFDLFAGSFDRNDELTISPFKSTFLHTRLNAGFAKEVFEEMNRRGASRFIPGEIPHTASEADMSLKRYRLERQVEEEYTEWVDSQSTDAGENNWLFDGVQMVFGRRKRKLTPGYVTKDACDGRGDDIEHEPLPHSINLPDFIASPFPDTKEDRDIDVVVIDFALTDFIAAVHSLKPNSSLGPWDSEPYAEGITVDQVWGKYAKLRW